MGLVSYIKNKHYENRLNKAEKLLGEGRASEAEQIFISILDKQPFAAGKLAAYYSSLAQKSEASKAVELLTKTIDLQKKGGSVYDTQSYDQEVKSFVAHIIERATSCYSSGSFLDCHALLTAINSSSYKSKKTKELCCEAKLQLIYKKIECTKSTDNSFKPCIDDFNVEWELGKSIPRARKTTYEFCDKLESQRRFYAANSILYIILDDISNWKLLDNAVKIISGEDAEASSKQIKETVSVFGKHAVLRNEQSHERSISIFDTCWNASHDRNYVISVFRSAEEKALRDSLMNHVFSNHSSYLSDTKLFDEFSKWIYEEVEVPLSIEALEKLHALGYNSEALYVAKVHDWSKTKPCDERIIILNHAHGVFPNSGTIINDKLDCAKWYLDNGENRKAITIADTILSKCEKASLIKAHAICNLAHAEQDVDKKVELLKESEDALGNKAAPDYETIRENISYEYLCAAEKYYAQNSQDKAYDVLNTLSRKGYAKALAAIAAHRLSEIRACDSVDQKIALSAKSIADIKSFSIPAIAECVEFQSIWDEYIAASINKFKTEDDALAVSEFEQIIKRLEDAGFSSSVKNKKTQLVTKELIRRKYLVARSLELSNNLDGAIVQYRDINVLEAKKAPTLSALRFIICKLKLQNNAEILQHKERIYTLLRNAADAFKAEKEDIAYRFALILLKSGEDKEALSVLNEFLPNEEHLRKACEQGAMIKAQAKLEDFNNKIDSVKNKTLSSEDAVSLVNHMLEYGQIIDPILHLTRPQLSAYRNKLKNYAIFKLFDEGKFATAFEKMIKEHANYLDDLTALRNIALICLNMAEEKQITSSNYEEVIAVWLTAIYQERLFIKSLDYTSWDDNYTFSLYEAYGHFNEDTVGDLPDNVNFDDSDESNVVSIREVQRALLDRFEAAIGDNQQYHEFFTSQKDAMDAFIALNLDVKCRLVAPFLAKKDSDVYDGITSALEHDREQEYDNWEDVLSVGATYQLEETIYTDYSTAKSYYDACNDAINTKVVSRARQAFTSSKISLIRDFDKLFSALVSTANSKVSSLSAKEKSDFKDNFNFYMIVCDAIRDNTLSYVFSNYVMSYVVGEVNGKRMKMSEAGNYILSIFLLDHTNARVRENLTNLFEILVRDTSAESQTAVAGILSKVRTIDNALYQKLYNESEQAKVDIELNEIVDKVNKDTMKKSAALEKVYAMYSARPNNSRICENLATLCDMCIRDYVISDTYGRSSVERYLNSLKANISNEFRRHNSVFRTSHDAIWNQLPVDSQLMMLGRNFDPNKTLNDKGYALKRGLEYYRALGEFEADDPFSGILGRLGLNNRRF